MLNSLFDYQSIDIASLVSAEPRSAFESETIEKLAHGFLGLGGNIKPLIVEAMGLDEFTILYGHLEYHAAVRAMAIDDSFEMVKGIIVNNKNRNLVIEQYLETFEQSSQTSNPLIDPLIDQSVSKKDQNNQNNAQGGQNLSDIKGMIANLEKGLNDHFDHRFSNLSSKLTKFIDEKLADNQIIMAGNEDHLAAFNSIDSHNFKQFISKLEIAGFKGKNAENIANAIAEERKKGEFVSFQDVIDRVKKLDNKKNRAITEKSMIKFWIPGVNGWPLNNS
ncbi:MAG: hypothetical protein HC796_09965 [Synechococcaceae cyanobacterium RL_1_2]|nr:hypothetical protein [Synechococcaceae cyanobacterium RL_1_2]